MCVSLLLSVSVPGANDADTVGLLQERAVPGQSCIQTSVASEVTCILPASWVLCLTANNTMNLKEMEEEDFVCGGVVQAEYIKFPLPGPWVGSALSLSILPNISHCHPLSPSIVLHLAQLLLQRRFAGAVTASQELPLEAFMAFS